MNAAFPLRLDQWLTLYGYCPFEKDDEELLKRVAKYVVQRLLEPVRFLFPTGQYEPEEYWQMLVLRNTQNSKHYIGKWCDTLLNWHPEVAAHKLLDPLKCPHIIPIVDIIEPYMGGKRMLITRRHKAFDMEVLKQYPKLVMFQLLTALKVVHENKIVHWDVCTNNIVWRMKDGRPHI